MTENIIIAIITATGSLLGAIIGAIATVAAASIKDKKAETSTPDYRVSPPPSFWKWTLIGAVIGAIILGTILFVWNWSQPQTSTVLLKEDFEDDSPQSMIMVDGNWRIISEGGNKVWDIDNSSGSNYAGVNFSPEIAGKNYTIEYRVKMMNFVPGATPETILYFRSDEAGNSNVQAFTPDYNGSKLITLGKSTNYSGWNTISTQVYPFDTNTWYEFKVTAKDNEFKVYVNGDLVINSNDTQISSGTITLQVGPGAHVRFDDILVSGSDS